MVALLQELTVAQQILTGGHVSPNIVTINALQMEVRRYLDAGYQPIMLRGAIARSYKESKMPINTDWNNEDLRLKDYSGITGIGLVTGNKSRHVIYDNDSVEADEAFCSAFPELVDTWTVQSGSGGYHYHRHYRLAPDVMVTGTRRYKGEYDYLAGGAYAVAPPTAYEGKQWVTVNRDPENARVLTARNILDIERFLAEYRGATTKQIIAIPQRIYTADLLTMYHELLRTQPRNESLFRTALHGKRIGILQADCEAMLLDEFVHTTPTQHTSSTKHETDIARRAEGLRTIASAYRYNPTSTTIKLDTVPANTLREYYFTQNASVALRVIEGLYLAGCKGYERMTRKQMEQTLKPYGLSAKTIRNATETLIANKPIFVGMADDITHGSDTHSTTATALKASRAKSNTQTIVCRGEKRATVKTPAKSSDGTFKPTLYIVPHLPSLLDAYSLENKGSDQIQADVLKSVKKYRIALLYAFIERNPGQWSKSFLAKRLGVTKDSITNYIKDAKIISLQQVMSESVNIWNVHDLLPEDAKTWGKFGIWLQDSTGQRHTPQLDKALRLLGANLKLDLVRQCTNYYAVSEDIIPPHIWQQQPTHIHADIYFPNDELIIEAMKLGGIVRQDYIS